MSAILRALETFGDAAGWLVAAVVFGVFARYIVRENNTAHRTLADGIKANGEAINALRTEVHAIAIDVAVLRERTSGGAEAGFKRRAAHGPAPPDEPPGTTPAPGEFEP